MLAHYYKICSHNVQQSYLFQLKYQHSQVVHEIIDHSQMPITNFSFRIALRCIPISVLHQFGKLKYSSTNVCIISSACKWEQRVERQLHIKGPLVYLCQKNWLFSVSVVKDTANGASRPRAKRVAGISALTPTSAAGRRAHNMGYSEGSRVRANWNT